MGELFEMLLGGYTIWQTIGFYFFMFLGITTYSLLEVQNRDIDSKNTPRYFSWKFWYKDNIKRYIATILFLYIQFRFFKELTGNDLSEYTSFLLGFSSDGLVGMKKKSTKFLHSNREKIIKNGSYETTKQAPSNK